MKSARILLAVFLLLGTGGMAHARSLPAGKTEPPPALTVPPVSAPVSTSAYTLPGSLEKGLRQNPTVRVADEKVASAAARYRQQQSQKNLHFVFGDKTTLQEKRTSKFGPLTVPTLDSLSSQITTSLQLLLTSFGRVENQIAAAFLQIGVESENARTTRNNLGYQVKQAFFNRLKSDASVEVATQNLQVSRQSLSDAQKLFAQGIMARYDVVQADLQVTEATEQLARARNSVQVSTASFLTVLNEPPRENIELEAPREIEVDPTVDLEALQALGLKRRPEMLALEGSLQVAQALLDAARSESQPNLTLSADYIASPGYHTTPQDMYQLNLGVKWALWDGGYRSGRIQEAESDIRSLEACGQELRNQICLQIERAWLDFKLTEVTLTTAAKRVEAAEIYYDMARQRFLNGLGTSLEVQDALRSLNDARQNQVVAVYDRELAFAALENSVGFDFPLRRLAVRPESLQVPGE